MFTEPEILRVSEGNGWRPSKGADKVDAYKGSSLKRDGLPSLLQLHLKRFKYDWETEETSKINDCCSFPVVSRMLSLCLPSYTVNLHFMSLSLLSKHKRSWIFQKS